MGDIDFGPLIDTELGEGPNCLYARIPDLFAGLILAIQAMLRDELACIGENRFLVTSPASLTSEGWSIAKSRDLIEVVGRNIQAWIEAYAWIGFANNTIAGRETFRNTNRALANYGEALKAFDNALIEVLEETMKRIGRALQTVPANMKPAKS